MRNKTQFNLWGQFSPGNSNTLVLNIMGQGQHCSYSETGAEGAEMLMSKMGNTRMGVQFPSQALDTVGLMDWVKNKSPKQIKKEFDPV